MQGTNFPKPPFEHKGLILPPPPVDLHLATQVQAFDQRTFYPAFAEELSHVSGLVLLQSAFFTWRGSERWVNHFKSLTNAGKRVCIFLQKPDGWDERERCLDPVQIAKFKQLEAVVEMLLSTGVHVTIRNDSHEKFVVVDHHILWEGSLNILSHFNKNEHMTRFHSHEYQQQIVKMHRLDECVTCNNRPWPFEGTGAFEGPSISHIGSMIAHERGKRRWSQADLAAALGTYQGLISRAESGKHFIKPELLLEMCSQVGLECLAVPRYLVPAIKDFVQSRWTL